MAGLNQRETKRALLHARARTYEDAARELRSLARTGQAENVEHVAQLFERRGAQLREDADATFGNPVDGMTMDEAVHRYCTKAD